MPPSKPALTSNPSHASHASRSSLGATDLLGPEADNFLFPEGPVSADVAELLSFPRSREHSRLRDVIGASDGESDEEIVPPATHEHAYGSDKGGVRRPNPWWILAITAFGAIVTSMTLAPRTEVYIRLVCAQYKPEYVLPAQPPAIPHNETFPLPPNSPVFAALYQRIVPKSSSSVIVDLPKPDDSAHIYVPRPSTKCTADPEVGRIVAGLATAITLTLGILSCITTGYWSNYSDRAGRKRVLIFSALGILATDIVFIVTTLRASRIPGGYNLFILGSVLDGLVGGLVTTMAISQAYVSDCADPNSRARTLSLFYGMWFSGMAIGPTLGGYLITVTGDMLSVFYLAAIGHMICALLIIFILPESLSLELRLANRDARDAAKLAANGENDLIPTSFKRSLWTLFTSLFSFLSPLAIFLPRKRQPGEPGYANGGRDWNLTLLMMSSGILYTLLGMIPLKFQYAEARFDWNSEMLGYYLTTLGGTRSLHLVFILPLLIRVFGPQHDKLRDPVSHHQRSDSQPLLDELREATSQNPARDSSLTPSHAERVSLRHGHHSADFDLVIARVSLLVDITAYACIFLSNQSWTFFVASSMSSFGSGFNPAMQSLALFLMPNGGKDAGKLFGALGMLGAISSQVVGPSAFGLLYMSTVATFPKAIFVAAFSVLCCAFIAISLIRLPRRSF